MKLPNGFGTVYRQAGNRRRPWVVKKFIEGHQKIIGYFDSYEHGLSFLVDYNKDPALFSSKITFSELYERWKVQKFPKISKSSIQGYEISYKHCARIHGMVFSEIRFGHLQDVIEDIHAGGSGYATQKKCRVLMEQLYAYAAKYDIVTRDYAQYVEIDKHIRKYKKKPFTVRQVNKMWRDSDAVPGVEDVLLMIYTGLRISEYLALESKDVKIRRRFFIVRKSKTEAGCDRPVPIAKKVYPFLEKRIHAGQRFICQRPDGRPYSYDSFRRVYDAVMEHFNFMHTPHETRHTTASWLDSVGANDTSVKMILGHARKGVTKKDYTHKTIRELRKAIDMI